MNRLERVLERANRRYAWKRVNANKGAPGGAGMTREDVPAYAREHWPRIRQSLMAPISLSRCDGSQSPSPAARASVWWIPTVLDRLIGQAILQVLTPIFDPGFSESRFGFRPGRSAHGALRQVQRYIQEGYRIAVDLDLEKFFGAPGQAWRFQRVRFPPRQGEEPPHRESSLGLMEVTT